MTLPPHEGYVAAAYIVFVVLVRVYIAIMAVKLTRIERALSELTDLALRRQGGED
jgi:type II secretory pathway component PulM